MKTLAPLVLIGIFCTFLPACEKLELPDSGSTGGKPPVIDTSSVGTPVITVSQLKASSIGTTVLLKAYIVGYAVGTSKSSFTLGLPIDKEVRANILVADTTEVDDARLCVPCQLLAKSDIREDLNLTDNPSVFHRKVFLLGTVDTYFGTKGLKPVIAYEWYDSDSEVKPTPPSSDTYIIPILQDLPSEPFEGC